MSLSWRLIISYVIIIFIALALAFVTLVLVARPIQNRVATARLVAQSRLVARQVNSQLERGVPIERVIELINSRPDDGTLHLLLVDTQHIIRADSQQRWLGQPFSPAAGDGQTGRFTATDGQSFNFARQQIGGADNPTGYVVAVTPRSATVPAIIGELGVGFVLAGMVALLVSLLASVIIARSIARPLQNMAAAATAVAGGDYTHRVPQQGPPEIKRLAASFNVMAGQVESSQQAMRDFVSNVSHELKTPLTSIQGFSQAIMEGATPDEAARRRAAGIIHQEAARMGRLVDDLLDLARIGSGQVVMQKTPLNLSQILNGTYNRLLPQAVEKNVTLEKKWGKLPPIVGDGDRLAQVFTNLLDNAVRHTPPQGKVTIEAAVIRGLPRPRHINPATVRGSVTTALSERGDFVEVNISDTGPGIPPQDLARIFERFYQVDKSRKRGQGTGLGLAIIKEIIEAHSGTVRAESVTGLGTRFSVLLPVTEADARTLISARK